MKDPPETNVLEHSHMGHLLARKYTSAHEGVSLTRVLAVSFVLILIWFGLDKKVRLVLSQQSLVSPVGSQRNRAGSYY